QMHRLRIELDGYQPVDTEVMPANWEGKDASKKAKVSVTLKAVPLDKKTHKPLVERLPAEPPNLAPPSGFTAGEGPIRIETSAPRAEGWLLLRVAHHCLTFPIAA